MTIFYFTGTGNSLEVAKKIGGELERINSKSVASVAEKPVLIEYSLISIPQTIDAENLHFKDDAIGIIFPIYWWNTPIMVRKFMERATLEADYLFAIGTYGNLPGAAMRNFEHFDYTNQILMLDNYIPVFDMTSQERKLKKKRVEEQIFKVADDIANKKRAHATAHLGKRIMTAFFKNIFKPENGAQKYIVDDKCNKCGVCAKVCPAKNISVDEKIAFESKCEGCLACLHFCPQNALHHKKEKSVARWRNPNISLNEIIAANNRTEVAK
jgi:ferredoxin